MKNRKSLEHKGSNNARVIDGTFACGSQYHFHLETQISIVTPVENGTELEVVTSSQGQELMKHIEVSGKMNFHSHS